MKWYKYEWMKPIQLVITSQCIHTLTGHILDFIAMLATSIKF